MIHLIGFAPSSDKYVLSTMEEFLEWEQSQTEWQLDTETNVVESIVERELILIQFGDITNTTQWVIQWSYLTEVQKTQLKTVLNNPLKTKLIHNATFEYTILFKYDVVLENVYDTMLVEKIITTGWKVDRGFYSLARLTFDYLNITLSKDLQTSFGDDILTPEKVDYAADDVRYLGFIRRLQRYKIDEYRLHTVVALENEAVLGYAEMEYFGMLLDKDKWLANVDLAQPIIDEARKELESMVRTELRESAIEFGFLLDKDSVNINWGSPKQRQEILQFLFPTLPGATKPIVNKFIKTETEGSYSPVRLSLLAAYQSKDFWFLNLYLETLHRDWLIENNLLTPADTITLNWNSPQQRLKLFQVVEPQLTSTNKEELVDADHPIIEAYQEYINATKLVSSFGEKFIEKYVDSDGRVRTRFDQILKTGRVSSSGPNLQNIPAKESVGTRYRNAFVAPKGWVYVDSDYSSQELVIIATFSKDPVWIKALQDNQDLHSVCAELVYGKRWVEGADETCGFYAKDSLGNILKGKCNCKKHKTMRTGVKTINFGLAYGMSKFKLSSTLGISVDEAAQLIEDYFKAFPSIGGKLEQFAKFGRATGSIVTSPPFLRRRWFDYWEERKDSDYWMGKVERASKNTPIQGTAADMMKLALCLMRWEIVDNKLRDRVQLVAQVHDQQTVNTREDYAEQWSTRMDELMREAALFIIPSGLLGAETTISPVWTK
jgi:DNA polymerase I-like protein with 3'-5' exonuclease and polymerase domains